MRKDFTAEGDLLNTRAERAVSHGRRGALPCATLVTVTARLPEESLYQTLRADPAALSAAGIKSVTAIGDALAPGTIAAAVYGGHRYAREIDAPPTATVPFARQLPGGA